MTPRESAFQAAGLAFERARLHGNSPAEAMADAVSELARQHAMRRKGRQRTNLPRRAAAPLSVPVRAVIDGVLASHGTTVAALTTKAIGARTGHWASRVRDEAVYVARLVDLQGASYPALGRLFERHHASLIHGQRAFAKRMKDNEVLAARMRRLLEAARGAGAGEQVEEAQANGGVA